MRFALFCLLITLLPAAAQASTVHQTMRPGINASADYQPGQRDQPAVLLLHGFLQTRDFSTVATLAQGLHDAGYTVLSPTLSLNIPNRSRSLACEAVHKHGMDEDVAEIGRWVAWLKSQGHRSIVLVGHSFGALQQLAYLSGQPDASIKAFLAVSLIEAQVGGASRAALIAQLESRIAHRQRTLMTHPLSFCTRYATPPEALLSYVRWDQVRTLTALKQSTLRMQLIMGDADNKLDPEWIRNLRHIQAPISIVPGAGHFMDGEHEFDLLEDALAFLQQARKEAPR
jgi:pimeloyl-ACP methyl ester carboxylesterase